MAASRKRPRGAARGGRRSVLVRLLPGEVEAIDRVRGGVDRNEWMRLVCARAVEAVEGGPSTLTDGLAALAAPGVNPSMVEGGLSDAVLSAPVDLARSFAVEDEGMFTSPVMVLSPQAVECEPDDEGVWHPVLWC